ncbi:dehydrogenase/reductase SDR family member 7-like isoform X1 [Diabrotica undecimpunctata]|uniref:dehydrogenase/reductase SDR family member 7-like isoform X1 n=1 Tax=Diabrotica undecimpunctata TaxID=50387 RepID=UPI003B632275
MFFTLLGAGYLIYLGLYTILLCVSDCDVQLFFLDKLGKSPRRLKGQVVFITGASSGIGEFTAYALAKYGVKLVLTARRPYELERVKNKCIELSKGSLQHNDVLIIPMDVTDFVSHKRHFQHAINHFGRVDILLNNAGRSQRAAWESIELEVDRQMFDLNVFGVINLTRVALEHFEKVGKGHVAVVSSLAGVIGAPYSGTYTATKHAIHGYYNSLRNEKMGKNLHVTLLCPGPTFTNFLQECFTDKNGQKLNSSVQPTDKRMTAERCGYLNAVALVNKTRESWMAIFPVTLFTYFAVYCPMLFYWGVKMIGPEIIFKLREGRKELYTVWIRKWYRHQLRLVSYYFKHLVSQKYTKQLLKTQSSIRQQVGNYRKLITSWYYFGGIVPQIPIF